MKILFYTCTHGRPETVALFLNNVKYIRKWVDVELLTIYSDDELVETNEPEYHNYTIYPNQPLGKKWNFGLEWSSKLDWDYIFITGSDDLYSPALIQHYVKLAEEGYHYIGLLDFYFYSIGRNMVKYYPGHYKDRRGEPQGAGRMLHRNVLEACNWKLWDDNINIALDASMSKTFEGKAMKHKFISLKKSGFVAIDIKDGKNIHKIEEYKGKWLTTVRQEAVLNAVGL